MTTLAEARASRAQARKNKARTYQGQACHAGHEGTRYTSNGTCVQCADAQRVSQSERIKAQRMVNGLPTRARKRRSQASLGTDILTDM